MYRVLIISDDRKNSSFLKDELKKHGFKTVKISLNNQNISNLLSKAEIDIILFNLFSNRIKKINDIIKMIKKKFNLPFIIVAPLMEKNIFMKTLQFNLCAYLVKPVNIETILSSIEIAIENSNRKKCMHDTVKISDRLSYNKTDKELLHEGKIVMLTKKERELLSLLIENINRTVSFFEIENRLWPNKTPNDNTRRSLVYRLRSKLKHASIQTIPSIGYRLTTTLHLV